MDYDQSPIYREDDFRAFIPFTTENDNYFTKDVRLKIRVPKYHGYRGTESVYEHDPPMDTGSTGLAISAADLGYTEEEQLKEYEKGTEYLSSSRVYYEGYWVPAKITFPDGNVTAEVKILAVTFSKICLSFNKTTGKCDQFSDKNPGGRPTHFPPKICYLGVGFGRWSMQQPYATADKNPLINVVETHDGMAVSRTAVRQGYVITDTGVWVGLARGHTQDFRLTKLIPNPKTTKTAYLREWKETSMFLDYHEQRNMQGTALFDTGVNQSYISAPAFRQVQRLPPGDKYTIKIGDQLDMPIETLHVTVGNFADPITPAYVRASPRETSFVNTGRFFFRHFDLLFDGEEGWLGLRRRKSCNFIDGPQPLVDSQAVRSSRPGALRRGSE